MDCTVTMEFDGKTHGFHFDLDALRALERAGWKGVVPLHDALRDMQLSAIEASFLAAHAGYSRTLVKRGAPAQAPLKRDDAATLCLQYGLTRTRDVLIGALAAAASPAEEEPADGASDPPTPPGSA